MSSPRSPNHITSDAPLGSLDVWPTSFHLPDAVVARVARLATRAGVLPATVVSAAVLRCLPAQEMQAVLAHRSLGVWPDGRATLFVRLPPPVTWRLNRIVEQVLMHDPSATRSRLLAVAVACAATTPPDQFDVWCHDVAGTPAVAAALPGGDPLDVLSLRRPAAGRRVANGRSRRLRPIPKER